VEVVEKEIPPTLILVEEVVVLVLWVNQDNKVPIKVVMVEQERE
tara:strand:- start:214 stop:345 length:132 start_codon:yes stop_codon:yes gene_type:complete